VEQGNYLQVIIYHHHHHKHQGLDPLIRSVSRVTTFLANVSSAFLLFSFLVVCSDTTSKGFGLVAFFASVKASSVCIRLSCPVCIQSVVHGIRSRLFWCQEKCSLPEVSITDKIDKIINLFIKTRNIFNYIIWCNYNSFLSILPQNMLSTHT